MSFIEIENFLWAGISFFAFLLTCSGLMETRLTRKGNILVTTVFLIVITTLLAGFLLCGVDQMLILTALPLSAYFPAIIGLHILSKVGFFQTVAIWTIGLLISYTSTFLQKFLIRSIDMQGNVKGLVITTCLFFVACILLIIVFRYIRRLFTIYVLNNDINWLPLCFPIVMIFLLFSYFKNSVTNPVIWILISLTALSIFLVITKALVSAALALRVQEANKAVSAQLGIQQREYEDICKKVELGRAYRHDLRHHLTVLNSLAGEKNNDEIKNYINGLDVKIKEMEREIYCENATLNAVLSSYIGQAKEKGCTVTLNVQAPTHLPFDPLDICAILANSIENAIHACRNNTSAAKRIIHITAVFEEEKRFIIAVTNHCKKKLLFDKDGLPVVANHEGHGIGLKSVKAIVEKYNGLLQCECKESNFLLRAILFNLQEKPSEIKKKTTFKKAITTTFISLFMFCFAESCVPVPRVLANVPILGNTIRVSDFRSYDFRWGDTELHIALPKVDLKEVPVDNTHEAQSPTLKPTYEIPLQQTKSRQSTTPKNIQEAPITPPTKSDAISWESVEEVETKPYIPKPPTVSPTQPGLSEGIDDINWQMEEYIKLLREKFLWHVARKYNGYVAMDSTYTTIRNDDKLLLIRFNTTINIGGSGTYSRFFMLDKKDGKEIELRDMFKENSDYIGIVSNEILRQMTSQVSAGLADYFIPGGIWSDEECFQRIAEDQNFYINDENQLVIVFDEYEVAPGKDGMPEFIIHTEVIENILQ